MLSRPLMTLSRQLFRSGGARWKNRSAIGSSYSRDIPGRRSRIEGRQPSQQSSPDDAYDPRAIWDNEGADWDDEDIDWGVEYEDNERGEPRETRAKNNTQLPDTVCIHNVPAQARTKEVLDLVLFGPVLHVDDAVHKGSRVVTLTFSDHDPALAFYNDATRHRMDLYGRHIGVSWGKGPEQKLYGSRAMRILARGTGRVEHYSHLSSYGPIDQIQISQLANWHKSNRNTLSKIYVNFLTVESCRRAVEALSGDGQDVQYVSDRCWSVGVARTKAANNLSRIVLLREIPSQVSAGELCDAIRGGALQKIAYSRRTGTAFVNFIEPSAANWFYQYAVYRGLIIHNRRISAQILDSSPVLPSFLQEPIRLGASRCFAIQGVLDEEKVWTDCNKYNLSVDHVSISGSKCVSSPISRLSRAQPSAIARSCRSLTLDVR
ncbi:hypothetical protein B0H17DRAFT_173652 [Mycena rosella]|uniref:RRM domain-containing protein n=1 Tax=Mycena rosella TaxID=1033263 RepID=A0AAD7D0C7_MYCRO|nr:hypothetical protein B0H17DRAFT_173652 [Mycena rosella]